MDRKAMLDYHKALEKFRSAAKKLDVTSSFLEIKLWILQIYITLQIYDIKLESGEVGKKAMECTICSKTLTFEFNSPAVYDNKHKIIFDMAKRL